MTTHPKRVLLSVFFVCQALLADPAAAQASPKSVAQLRLGDPYKYVGLLTFDSDGGEYIGSATVIKPYSLLTAGHNLYSEFSGWSTNVVFERGYNFGARESRSTASSLFVLGGYAGLVDSGKSETNLGFSRDMGGVVCFSQPADGFHAAWANSTKLLTGKSYNMLLGYGADIHSGEQLLRSSPSKSFYRIKGSFFENRSCGIESGMSGGPVFAKFNGSWFVCAVNVSGPSAFVFNRGAGVRAIDADAEILISTELY